jgi:hypothetical protein
MKGQSRERQGYDVPNQMRALQYEMLITQCANGLHLLIDRYSGPERFAVETIDVPKIGDDDVLVCSQYAAEFRVMN